MSWGLEIFSLEIRKRLSYRLDFWFQFLGVTLVQVGISYFMWKAVFEWNQAQILRGYTFRGLMFYALLVPLVELSIRGQEWIGFIARDIYDGTLTRYLVYPLSFFSYKYIAHLAQTFLGLFQSSLALGFFLFFFGFPDELKWSFSQIFLGLISIGFATVLFFALASSLEMIAFWAETVWSLLVLLRLATIFLGGGMIPLDFFPHWLRSILDFLPFRYLVAFPIQTFLGQIGFKDWLWGMGVLLFWIGVSALACRIVWKKGSYEYTGVGI